MAQPSRQTPADESDAKYFITVGILMVVIIAALAALWLMERRRRTIAEGNLGRVMLKYDGLKSISQADGA